MYIGIETTAIAIPPPAYQITSASDSTSKPLMSITLPSNHHLFNKHTCPTAWSTKLEGEKIHEFSPKVQPGPTISIPTSPMEIFHLFYSSDILDKILKVVNFIKQDEQRTRRFGFLALRQE